MSLTAEQQENFEDIEKQFAVKGSHAQDLQQRALRKLPAFY